IARFNAYLVQVRGKASPGKDTTQTLIQCHYRLFVHWRRFRLGQQAQLPEVQKSTPQDRADLVCADEELQEEWTRLQQADTWVRTRNSAWLKDGYLGMLLELGILHLDLFVRTTSQLLGSTAGYTVRLVGFDDLPGGPVASINPSISGLQAVLLYDTLKRAAEAKWTQWKAIENDWNDKSHPHAAVCALFEQDMHDSRAWFKPLGDDDDVWVLKQREQMSELLERERQDALIPLRQVGPAGAVVAAMPPLSSKDRETLAAYRRRHGGNTPPPDKVPDDAWPTQNKGRELYELWGYLRWRTVYQDHLPDYRARYPQHARADRSALLTSKRKLEREAEQLDEAIKKLDKEMQKATRIGPSGPFGGGGGSYPTADQANRRNGLYARQQEVEAELTAIHDFLSELGPKSWWEQALDAVMPG
ncbi:hypothetical protein P3W85_23760, partial [Cupriavidus basilensis]|nr:hypothetical protein [Cupriavidus basilensis]